VVVPQNRHRGTDGLIEVSDSQIPPPPSRYYRMVYP